MTNKQNGGAHVYLKIKNYCFTRSQIASEKTIKMNLSQIPYGKVM